MNELIRRSFACIFGHTLYLLASSWALGAQPHGDHNPHHGGLVLMQGMDLHYEIAVGRDGAVRLYFTDGAREDLPASMASEVAVEVERPGANAESVAMVISADGECWEGASTAARDDAAIVHLAFEFQRESAAMALPVAAIRGMKRAAGEVHP